MPDMIRVRSGRKDQCCALWEIDKDHPNGEVFVGPDRTVEVARTAAVEKGLREGTLVPADAPEAPAPQAEAAEDAAPRGRRG